MSVQPVNEHDPVISCQLPNTAACPGGTTFTASVNENSVMNTAVATMSATDADEGSNHAIISWSIESGNNMGYFKIVATSTTVGAVSV